MSFIILNDLTLKNIRKLPEGKIVALIKPDNKMIYMMKKDTDTVRTYDSISLPYEDDDIHMSLVPNTGLTSRECVVIVGPSGSGKSTWTSDYARNYLKIFPNRKVIMFSKIKDDPAFKGISMIQPELNSDLKDLELDYKHLRNCLVIFDDSELVNDKELYSKIKKIQNDILDLGRHENIHCLITMHQGANYRKTQNINNECHYVVLCEFQTNYNSQYYLKNYCGFSSKQIKFLNSLKSRWICVHKHSPRFVLHEKGIFIPRNEYI